jgi:hypothetical protein
LFLLLLKGFFVLIGIMCLIYLSFRVAKKRLQKAQNKPQHITIVEQKYLDQKHLLSLVMVKDVELFVITGPHTIRSHEIHTQSDASNIYETGAQD